jgi:hypothetical protein
LPYRVVVRARSALRRGPEPTAPEKAMSDYLSHLAVPIAITAVAVVLVIGLANTLRGGSPNLSQRLMRLRVLLQFIAIIIVMVTIWMLGR